MLRCTGHATRPADTPTSLFLLPHAPSYSLRYRRTKLSRVVGCCCPFVPVVWLLNGSEEEKTTTKESLSFLRLQSRRRPSRERERADGWARIQIHDAPSSSSSAPSGSHPLTSFRPDKKMYKTRGKEKRRRTRVVDRWNAHSSRGSLRRWPASVRVTQVVESKLKVVILTHTERTILGSPSLFFYAVLPNVKCFWYFMPALGARGKSYWSP